MVALPRLGHAGVMSPRPSGPDTERPTDDLPPTTGPSGYDRLRRLDLRRSPDSWLGGVCSGLAHRIGVDPLVVRAGAILLAFVFGRGVLLYLLAWVLIPDTREETHTEKGLRGGQGASIGLIVVTALVALGSLPLLGWDGRGFGFGVLALAVSLFLGYVLWRAWQGRPNAGAVDSGAQSWYAAPPAAGQARYAAPPAPGQATATGAAAYPVGAPPTGAGPLHQGNVPAPPPPGPRHKRRHSGGLPAALLALGLLIATVTAVIWAHPSLDLVGNPAAIGLAAGLVVLGAILLVLGLAGRRAGFVGFLAGLTLLSALVVAPLPDDIGRALDGRADSVTWLTPDAPADTTFELGAGEAVLDLRGMDPAAWDGEVIEAYLGAGELHVLVPDDTSALVVTEVGVGGISTQDSLGSSQDSGGLGLESSHSFGDGPLDVRIEASVGLGRIVLVIP